MKQNTVKVPEIKSSVEDMINNKVEEQAKIIENKLYTAEQNREREIQKKLEKEIL